MNKKIDELGRLVIPKEMRLQLGIQDNDTLNINVEGNKIVITKDYDEFDEYLNALMEHCEDQDTYTLLRDIRSVYNKES